MVLGRGVEVFTLTFDAYVLSTVNSLSLAKPWLTDAVLGPLGPRTGPIYLSIVLLQRLPIYPSIQLGIVVQPGIEKYLPTLLILLRKYLSSPYPTTFLATSINLTFLLFMLMVILLTPLLKKLISLAPYSQLIPLAMTPMLLTLLLNL